MTSLARKKKLLPELSQDLSTEPKLHSFYSRTPVLLLLGLITLICGPFFIRTNYSSPEAIEPCSSITLQVYRYSNIKPINYYQCISLEDFVILAQKTFNDSTIARFTNDVGEEIKTMSGISSQHNNTRSTFQLIALDDNERFIWPALKIGEKKKLRLVGDQEVTVTTLSDKPRVFQLDNFLKPEECEHMINRITKENLIRSQVGEDRQTSDYRTSSQTWIGPGQGNDDAVFSMVRRRAHELTRLPYELGEDTQVVRYQVGQHYYAHHDYFGRNSENSFYRNGGNRIVTVLYYLNDVELGGETIFPYTNSSFDPYTKQYPYNEASKACALGGLKVKPSKGGAVFFYSLAEIDHMNGEPDPYSLHAGCDPIKGEKWIVNQWINNKLINGRMF